MRILLVEDNANTAAYLSQGLKENYFIPEVASNGQDGLFMATQHEYDVLVLDVMLPELDGWSLVKKIRESNKTTPILFLTARDTIEDRVKGLELGADDYLVKPFSFSEFLARLRSLLRRKQPQQASHLQIGDLIIDTQKHKITRAQTAIQLTAKEYQLLLFLANKKGEVVTRTQIAEQVWDINFDSDTNAIDVAIKRLRDKMDKNFSKPLIRTVRGVGYVLDDN
jgi:two-component system copper resistance phosphate regulon response regulator CusR